MLWIGYLSYRKKVTEWLQPQPFMVMSSKTATSWHNLEEGYVDLILAYDYKEPENTYHQQHDYYVESYPIGRDALVFMVNAENPVHSLSREELVNIYTGRTTNWAELGGEDQEILPFQRNPSSGSQAMFLYTLMQWEEPMEAPKEHTFSDMGEIVNAVADYNNGANAIGYSVYYYISRMKNDPAIRLLEVDGIAPTNETIANHYPLTNTFYVAIRSNEPEDSPARLLCNWILSDAGRQCLIDAGYVPAH